MTTEFDSFSLTQQSGDEAGIATTVHEGNYKQWCFIRSVRDQNNLAWDEYAAVGKSVRGGYGPCGEKARERIASRISERTPVSCAPFGQRWLSPLL